MLPSSRRSSLRLKINKRLMKQLYHTHVPFFIQLPILTKSTNDQQREIKKGKCRLEVCFLVVRNTISEHQLEINRDTSLCFGTSYSILSYRPISSGPLEATSSSPTLSPSLSVVVESHPSPSQIVLRRSKVLVPFHPGHSWRPSSPSLSEEATCLIQQV